jgi:hypothetical protein
VGAATALRAGAWAVAMATAAAAASTAGAGCGDGSGDGGATRVDGPARCGGTEDCYSVCYCGERDEPACRSRCAVPADSPIVRDVSGWAADVSETSLLSLVNAVRGRGGCCASGRMCLAPAPALTVHDDLVLAARRHAADMAARSFFSHQTPEGATLADRIRAAGYAGHLIGENLAVAYSTADEVVAAWLASVDHCENVLWPDFTHVGIARHDGRPDGAGPTWVADLGGGI